MQELLNDHNKDLSEYENNLISFIVNPSKIQIFNSEEAAEDWGENELNVEENSEVEGDTVKTPADVFNKFRESMEVKREMLFKAVALVLADNLPPTSERDSF
ncbi:hypothetical protein ACFS7Z_24315 [Pontibacter toksunensis]|uniref:Uncharacterized protein n=1 Tax=Pontibacter toksunensis TaxID=1332631 RepID=A0ABW6C1C9_9BACT